MRDSEEWREVLKHIFVTGWDRFITYSCFIGYGLSSLLQESPRGTAQSAFPTWLGAVFNAELIFAGTLLMASLIWDSFWLRWAGFSIFFIGMVTIAFLIMVGSGSPVWVLVFGLAMQGLISLRNVTLARSVNQELLRLTAELEKKRDSSGT